MEQQQEKWKERRKEPEWNIKNANMGFLPNLEGYLERERDRVIAGGLEYGQGK